MDGTTLLKPNSVLEYTILVKNIGLNTASDVQVFDAIPQYTSYKTGSLNITTGANSSPPGKTDGTDGDQAEFEAIKKRRHSSAHALTGQVPTLFA